MMCGLNVGLLWAGECGCDVVRGVLFVLLECVRVVACGFGLIFSFWFLGLLDF
jgi:hypothetical protein